MPGGRSFKIEFYSATGFRLEFYTTRVVIYNRTREQVGIFKVAVYGDNAVEQSLGFTYDFFALFKFFLVNVARGYGYGNKFVRILKE